MKAIYNLVDRLQRNESVWWDFIVFINEIYMKCLIFVTRIKFPRIERQFSIGEKIYFLRSIDIDWYERLLNFFEFDCSQQTRKFVPHRVDPAALKKVLKRCHYLCMGIFQDDKLVGYCVNRLFLPRKCLYAIVVGDRWKGMGIGPAALREQILSIREIPFHPLSAVRKSNKSSLKMLERAGVIFGEDLGEMRVTLGVEDR